MFSFPQLFTIYMPETPLSDSFFFPCLDPPFVNIAPCIPPPVVDHNIANLLVDPSTPSRKRPARIPGLVGTNAAFLVPEHIRKKFSDGWNVHVPLTYLTDKGCLLRDKGTVTSSQDILTIDSSTGRLLTSSKPLQDDGELDLSFDEWHQAWRRLLDLIKTHLPEEFLMWEVHYLYILNNHNRAELWSLYLAYDAEIRRRSTQLSIDPSQFSIGIWNDLETRHTAKKVLSMVQADLRLQPNTRSATTSRDTIRNPSFRGQHHRPSQPDSSKPGRCIFCGDRSKSHTSRNCSATSNITGAPCHLLKQASTGTRQGKSGKVYCYAWNGFSGCDQGSSCQRGEHWCTLCGSIAHNAQLCNIV
jgi:hypothetical protein